MSEYTPAQQEMLVVFQQYVAAEIQGPPEIALTIITGDSPANYVSGMARSPAAQTSGVFLKEHLVRKFFPPDVNIKRDRAPQALSDCRRKIILQA